LSSPSQYAIYVRQWKPSKYELEPFDEIVIDSSAVDELKNKLSLLSGLPVECIEFAKVSSPCFIDVYCCSFWLGSVIDRNHDIRPLI
jgi:ubiquitin carboxyl-terminal hydrolase 47